MLLMYSYAQAQNPNEATHTPNEMAWQVYEQAIEKNQLISQGKVYGYLYPQASGSHYIMDEKEEGRLVYDGLTYKNMALYYDMYNDLIFFSTKQDGLQRYLILDQQKISAYQIGDLHFIHLFSSPDTMVKKGLYQLAFEQGAIRLLVKKRKELIRDAGQMAGQKRYKFVNADVHYLFKQEGLFIIKRKKDLLKAFGNHSELKSFIKKEGIRLKANRGDFTSQLVRALMYKESSS